MRKILPLIACILCFYSASSNLVVGTEAKCLDDASYPSELHRNFTLEAAWFAFDHSRDDHIPNKELFSAEFASRFNEWHRESITISNMRSNLEVEGVESIYTNISIVASESDPVKALKMLDLFVDCSAGCSRYNDANGSSNYYLFKKWKMLNFTDSQNRVTFFMRELSKIYINDDYTDSTSCELCEQIEAAKQTSIQSASKRRSLDNIWQYIYRVSQTIASKLDPNQWIILIVSVWLITCLIIAILIQKRDRRRLRLYLEERADDYSFSKR